MILLCKQSFHLPRGLRSTHPPTQRLIHSRPDRFHRDTTQSQLTRGHETPNARLSRKPVRSFHENASASRLSNSPSTCRADSPICPRSDSTRATTPASPDRGRQTVDRGISTIYHQLSFNSTAMISILVLPTFSSVCGGSG
jgi:hypothetical protein